MYGEGISKEGELLDLGEKLKFVKKSGAWFSYGEDRIGQGRDNAKMFLRENPDVAAELEQKIRENFDTLREMEAKTTKPKKTAAKAAAPAEENPETPAAAPVSLDVSADDFE
jgi:recombination protein RecA